jgi:hypothetical protein
LPGLGQRTTSVWTDKALWAALFELDCCPGFKADTAGECHDPDGRPAAKATLAPEDLDEEVRQARGDFVNILIFGAADDKV